MYDVDTITRGRLTATIAYDDDPLSPFTDYDPPCKMIVTGNTRDYGHLSTASWSDIAPEVYQTVYSHTWYRETDAGTEVEIGDDDDLVRYIERTHGAVVVMASITGSAQREWFDAAFVMTRDDIMREWSRYARPNARRVTKQDRDRAREMIDAHISTIQQYMDGDVYNVFVTDDEGEHVDSCGSFYGYGYAREEAERMLQDAIDDDPQYQYPSAEAWEDPEYRIAS